MDGNRRWAKVRGLPAIAGHRAGYETLKQALVWAKRANLETVYLYAFSTENWQRTDEEVNQLMDLFRSALAADADFFLREDIKLTFIGDLKRLAPDLQEKMKRLERETVQNKSMHAVFAVSYGGRIELVAAAEQLRQTSVPITEASFAATLWTNGLPDPELIIRTGGQHRLSNFLLWQCAYAELVFLDVLWPDLTEDVFRHALQSAHPDERRFGR